MQRRKFIRQVSIAGAGSFLIPNAVKACAIDFPVVRISKGQRKFNSDAIEKVIANMKKRLKDPELGWLFENCFPNTLDTTVDFEIKNGKPDTYVITGDIDAMWLRDSSAQVWPYLPFMKHDKNLQQLIAGVIRRQTQCILLNPYANAFYKDRNKISEWKDDFTEMKPGVHERKWEIDSLCYPIRLAYGYWKETGDTILFDNDWKEAMRLVVKTFKEQQRFNDKGPYHFQRKTSNPTDSVPLNGYGNPVKANGLICSVFRPSDDATIFLFLIPDNLFALNELKNLSEIFKTIGETETVKSIEHLRMDLHKAITNYGMAKNLEHNKIYAYEVNGFGSYHLMDDANVPSLLSFPYVNAVTIDDPVYVNTRKYSLSNENPFFFKGSAAQGIGGPHIGMDYIWPMGIIMRAMTSNDDAEIKQCIQWLKTTHAGTGFMHEAFHKDDATKYTRKWFAWANTLFGELLLKVTKERPHLV